MAELSYRNYSGPEDLELQYRFWNDITAKLPYCWKATKSPTQFLEDDYFGIERSRCFAYVEETLIGYCSFTGQGSFVSMGYPWVDEATATDLGIDVKEVQQELWKRVFGFAKCDFGGEQFLQRFREQWGDKIEFFESKGFRRVDVQPIYMIDAPYLPSSEHDNLATELEQNFDFGAFREVALKNPEQTKEALDGIAVYYDSIDFDEVISVKSSGETVGYFGTALREETGLAEVIAAAISPAADESTVLSSFLSAITLGDTISFTVNRGSEIISSLKQLGFERRSADVYVGLDLSKK